MSRKGKCMNIGNGCHVADSKRILEIPEGNDFVCSDCGSELIEVNDDKQIALPWKKILLAVGIIVIVGIVYSLFQTKTSSSVDLPYIALKDTMISIRGKNYSLNKGDSLLEKHDSVYISKNKNSTVSPPKTAANCPPHPNLFEEIKSRGLNVVMEEDSPPMFYTENDKLTGFGYDFAKILCSRLGVKMNTPTNAPFPDLINKVTSGAADIVIAGERKEPNNCVLWSDSYLENGLCLIVKAGSGINNYKQLSEKKLKVGLFKGDDNVKNWVLANIPGAQIDDRYLETGWLSHLNSGEWDAVIYDYIFAISEIKKLPDLRIVQFNIDPIEYSIAIPTGNQDLLREINKQIAIIKESSDYENLYRKYLSTDKTKISVSDLSDCREPNCHVVKPGETLGKIAKDILGDPTRYMEIFELNKNRIASPHLIYIGNKLQMPVDKKNIHPEPRVKK